MKPDIPHILLIDDEPDIRDALALGLSFAGFFVQTAAERLCGVAMLKKYPECFDVIVMDWNMPGMTAKEFMAEARKLCEHIPIVLVTGAPNPAEIAKSLNLKFWLQKPIEFERLVDTVKLAMA